MLFSFAGVFVFLGLFTLQEALNADQISEDQTIVYQGSINKMGRTFFKSAILLTFEIDGYCSEFVCTGFRPFHYQDFKDDFVSGMKVEFAIRKTEQTKFDSCQRCEIVSLKSENKTYLSLSEHNSSSYTAKRIVAGGITGALFTAGFISLILALFSARESEQTAEIWERNNVFRRSLFRK